MIESWFHTMPLPFVYMFCDRYKNRGGVRERGRRGRRHNTCCIDPGLIRREIAHCTKSEQFVMNVTTDTNS
jgi:hypothetical protein